MWSYHLPDTLAIFTPIPGDTLATVISFAQSALKGNMATDKALLLLPGAERLTDPAGIRTISPGTSGSSFYQSTGLGVTVVMLIKPTNVDLTASV